MKKSLDEIISIIIGSSGGALCRWYTIESSYFKSRQYLGILLVNGIGSFILGSLSGFHSKRTTKPHLSLLVGVGFCGALTTFSTYSMDVLKFTQNGELYKATAYILASNLIGIGGVVSGYTIARKILR